MYVGTFCSIKSPHFHTPTPSIQIRRMVVGGGGDRKAKQGGACTRNACKSCTAGVIADCVAVCCCPCAVVDILFLALFKVPWTLGRKWLGLQRKTNKRIAAGGQSHRSDGIPRMGSVEDENLGIGIRDGQIVKDIFSVEELDWLDLYPVGHFGFGRVSFTEIPSQCKGN